MPASHVDAGTTTSRQREKAAEDADDQDPVEDFERPLDSPADGEHSGADQKGAHADVIDRRRVAGHRQAARDEKEDRPGSSCGEGRPAELQEIQADVRSRPTTWRTVASA